MPFKLTRAQERVIRELDSDLQRAVPMERLLQGDVGSGKTVVAVYALLRAVEADCRGALMAPTETLAEQHFLTVESLCTQLGVTCGLPTSSVGKRDREAAQASVVVGTHALIQAGVDLATSPSPSSTSSTASASSSARRSRPARGRTRCT